MASLSRSSLTFKCFCLTGCGVTLCFIHSRTADLSHSHHAAMSIIVKDAASLSSCSSLAISVFGVSLVMLSSPD